MPRPRNDDLTARQCEVLRLIAAGKTNAEIASSLGISLDGAKYHVREVVTKLGADSREDAVARWSAQQGLRARTSRALHSAIVGLGWLKAGVAVAVLGIAAGAVVLVIRDTGGRAEPRLPDSASAALQQAQAALDRADAYTLRVEQTNFVLRGWGGSDGGTVQVADRGKSARAVLSRTGETAATYIVVLVNNETFFQRSTCSTMFRVPGGEPGVLTPFLFGATQAFARATGASYVTGAPNTVEATVEMLGRVAIEIDPSTGRPVRVVGESNGQPLRWTFGDWGTSLSIPVPTGSAQDRGPGGIPC